MTVLVAVNTKNAIIMAADSQGTLTRPFIDPEDLSEFFEMDNGRKLKTDANGQPVLDTWSRIACHTMEMPYKIHGEVDKIFSLEPLKMGIMSSGISSIGERTIKSLISEFRNSDVLQELRFKDYTIEDVAVKLLNFLWPKYEDLYSSDIKPELELIICGYDRERFTPGIVRIHVHRKIVAQPDYDFCISFGGITREIQRLLFGIDAGGKARLIEQNQKLMRIYHERLQRYLKNKGVGIELPRPKDFGSELGLFNNFQMDTLTMNCATYSEQDAVECADFLINVMIKTQKFSDQFPSCGGRVQLAIVKKQRGFQFVSPRPHYLD